MHAVKYSPTLWNNHVRIRFVVTGHSTPRTQCGGQELGHLLAVYAPERRLTDELSRPLNISSWKILERLTLISAISEAIVLRHKIWLTMILIIR